MFCKKPETVVSVTTLKCWLNAHNETEKQKEEPEPPQPTDQINMVCSTVTVNTDQNAESTHKRLFLEEMVVFHNSKHTREICLNKLSY